jgi:two-component system chemotaxis response regulator CheB
MIRSKERKPGEKIHVLIVDDSAVVRQIMQAILETDRGIRVTTASDPLIALTKMARELPDVIVTDLEMPRMDGLTFLRKIMSETPTPVVICSGLAARGADVALRALEEGAVEIITKPKLGVREFLHESAVMLLDTVWSAAHARVRQRPAASPQKKLDANAVLPAPRRHALELTTDRLIAVGASTGGTEALRTFLMAMPPDCPAIVIVQHMPEMFTRAFANRLNTECAIEIKEAADGDRLIRGRALIAPGNHHLLVHRSGGHYVAEVASGPLVSRHRPSVDVLFRSVAGAAGANAVGVIMTGMGDDGAAGMLEMKQAGATNIAQDEATCVVFGMPKEAIKRGGIDRIVPLEHISHEAIRLTQNAHAVVKV